MDCDEFNFFQQKDQSFFTKIDEDLDYAFALSLQEEFLEVSVSDTFSSQAKLDGSNIKSSYSSTSKSSEPLGIVDEQWEIIDPNPDVHALFLQYNAQFFYGKLDGVEVRWSPRMTLCAGVCCYEGRGGLCSVRLSLPLLKLRPRRDLVETLLHEMIHAYLFVTANNKDRDGHGPEFLKHMNRINKETGTRISVYHSFHDEVDMYRKHWWKCNGPCQKKRPFYGLVKRAMNRAPSPRDTWWSQHQSSCGGTFIKIKEPEDYKKKSLKRKPLHDASNKSQSIKKFIQSGSTSKSESGVARKQEEKNVNDIRSILSKDNNVVPVPIDNTESSSSLEEINIIPFSGQGFKLGSSSSAPPRTFLANLRQNLMSSKNKTSTSHPKNMPSDLTHLSGVLDNRKPTTDDARNKDAPLRITASGSSSTKKLENTKLVQSSIQKYVTSPPRTINKGSEHGTPEIIHIEESSSLKVECPVCSCSFTTLEINTHLDKCLLNCSGL